MKKVLLALMLLTVFVFGGCFSKSGNEDAEGVQVVKRNNGEQITVYYKANVQWIANPSAINMHYNKNNSGWTAVPGVAMTKHTSQYDEWFGYASITVDATTLKFCFNQNGSWDNNGGKDYNIGAVGTYKVENGQIIKVEDATKARVDLYYSGTVYPVYAVYGLTVDIYKENSTAVFMTSTMTGSSSGTHGTYAMFRDVPTGKYTAKVNQIVDGYKYIGEASFEVKSGQTVVSGTIIIEQKEDNKGRIFIEYQPQTISLYGKKVKVYKNGGFLQESEITATSEKRYNVVILNDLSTAKYKVVLDETLEGMRYTSQTEYDVDGTSDVVQGGVVTLTGTPVETKAMVDVYYSGTIYPTYLVYGLTLNVYKENQTTVFKSATISGSSDGRHGVYASFRDIPAGKYTVKVNQLVDGYKYVGEGAFEVTVGQTALSANINIEQKEDNKGWLGIHITQGYDGKLIGQNLKVYKNGTYLGEYEIGNYSYFYGECYTGLHDLGTGTYKAVLDVTVENIRYTGEASVEVDGTNVNEVTVSIPLTKTPVNTNKITVYYRANVQWIANPSTINMHYNKNNSGWTAVPGVAMTKHTSQYDTWFNYASITVEASTLKFCFNNNGSWDNNGGKDYYISAPGTYKVENGQIIKQ